MNAAEQLIIQVRQHMNWGQSPDEALQNGIKDIFPDASDDAQADLFARICEDEFTPANVAKAIKAAVV